MADPGVQARVPHELSVPSLLHEHGAPGTAWTTVNTAEALPGLVTPLTWSFWSEPLEVGMRGAFADLGVLAAKDVRMPNTPDERFSAVFYGRVAGNVDRLRWCADRLPGTSGKEFERQILSSVRPEAPGGPTRSRYPMIAMQLPVAATRIPRMLEVARGETHGWWQEQTRLSSAEPERLRGLLVAAQQRFHTVMRRHILATMLAQAAYDQLGRLAVAADQEGAERELATGYGDLEESVILGDLWEVSRGRLTIVEFVCRHGYHGPSEGELSSTSWRADARLLDTLVTAHRSLDVSPTDRQRERAAVRAAAQTKVLNRMGRLQRVRARAVLGFAARHIPLREVGKAAFLQAIDVARFAATELGRHLCDKGVLTNPSDVFLLTVQELSENALPGKGVLDQRRQLRHAFTPFTLPERWTGNPTPVIRDEPLGMRLGDSLTGVPVSGGVVEGRVRVLTGLVSTEAEDFHPGEILVCCFTDPSWTLLMNLAAALVIDVGGALSHGAIVARELGVPTVINTVDGTRLLKTGDRVRVDADAGIVELLDRPDAVAGMH